MALWVLLGATLGATVAQPPADPPRADGRDAKVEAAADAAFQDLADRVLTLRLSAPLTVAGLLVAEPEVESWLRQSLFEARQVSDAHALPDGVVEVEVRVPADAAADLVRSLAERYLPGTEVSALLADRFAEDMMAVGRTAEAPRPSAPAGWRHCSARQLELAAAAARIDLRQRLLARVEPWLLSPVHTVGRLFVAHPELRDAAGKSFDRLNLPEPVFEPWGVCRLTAKLPRAVVVEWLTTAARLCEPAIEEDLSRAVDPDGEDPLVVDGYAVAPPTSAITPMPSEADPRPDWVDRTLSIQAPHRIEALRRIWLEIERLACTPGMTLADLLEAQDEPAVAMGAIEAAIRWSQPSDERVAAELDLAAVWDIVRQMIRTGVTTQPAATRRAM